MAERLPDILTVQAATDDVFGRPQRVPGFVDIAIVLRGIKSAPVEDCRLSAEDALKLAENLLRAVRQSGVVSR